MGMKLSKELEQRVLELAGEAGKPAVRTKRPQKLAGPSLSLDVTLPVVTRSEANLRDWKARSRRTKDARQAWESMALLGPADRCVVTMTRLGGKMLDDDNLRSALKAVRDAVAAWLGCDDADSRLAFCYGQKPGGPYGVQVRVSLIPTE